MEVDWMRVGEAKSIHGYVRSGYEYPKGFQTSVTAQYLGREDSVEKIYGFGFQWFPRPHVELSWNTDVIFLKSVDQTTLKNLLLIHYYL